MNVLRPPYSKGFGIVHVKRGARELQTRRFMELVILDQERQVNRYACFCIFHTHTCLLRRMVMVCVTFLLGTITGFRLFMYVFWDVACAFPLA